MKTLHRAADTNYAPTGSCFASARQDAEAYLDNPGFGGSRLWVAQAQGEVLDVLGGARDLAAAYVECLDADGVEEESSRLLEWDMDEQSYIGDLADALAEEWDARGLDRIFKVIENASGVWSTLVRSGKWSWVVYEDDYPERAECWRYAGRQALELQPA